MIANVLRITGDRHPNQYFTSRGVPKAIKKALGILNNAPCYVLEVDITKCFNSFNEEKLPNLLPLPKDITRKGVISTDLNIVVGGFLSYGVYVESFNHVTASSEKILHPYSDAYDELCKARQGIPQGSICSPIVCETLLAPVVRKVCELGDVINYCDNFLIIAQNKADVALLYQSLREVLMDHPAGPLPCHGDELVGPYDTFEFLGHMFEFKNGKYQVRPTKFKQREFNIELRNLKKKIIHAKCTGKNFTKLRQRTKEYIVDWHNSYSNWEQFDTHKNKYLVQLEKLTST